MVRLPVGFERLVPLTLSKQDKVLLKATLAKPASSVWGHYGNEWFRHKFRDALLAQQGNRCCYCRRTLSINRGAVEIDHVVHKGPKTGHPAFAFHPMNLAAACKDCNNVKGRKAVLARPDKRYVRYPLSASAYSWVHPYLHDYSQHIEIYDGWVYKAVVSADGPSENGKAVIQKCGLNKISMIEMANRTTRFEQTRDAGALIREALAQTNHAGLEAVAKEIAPLLQQALGTRATEALSLFEEIYRVTQKTANNSAEPVNAGVAA